LGRFTTQSIGELESLDELLDKTEVVGVELLWARTVVLFGNVLGLGGESHDLIEAD